MPRVGVLALLGLAACAAATPSPSALPAPPAASAPAQPRFFLNPQSTDFCVERTADHALFIASGARLEVSRTEELTAAAWSTELVFGDALVGALAVPPRLGGGFVHWSHRNLFRTRTFTGALEPIATPGITRILGARAGLGAVVVFTDTGARELTKAGSLGPLAEPGVLDLAAVSDRRAARLDLFGHLSLTEDGGRTWVDLSPSAGLLVRRLVPGPNELYVETQDARALIQPGGRLDLDAPVGRANHEVMRAYEIAWQGPRSGERDYTNWSVSGSSPLAAAVAGGGAVGDGTAVGVVNGTPLRVELETGRLVGVAGEWIPNGLVCAPHRAPDALLLACSWERYQARGGYVMRVARGEAPVVEHAFGDDGTYVADDEGALGFVGSCGAKARWFDPEESNQPAEPGSEPPVPPVFCERRGPGDWVEHRIDVTEGESLVAWIPGRGGRAAAITVSTAPLPAAASPAGRASVRSGVHVVQIDRDLGGWTIPKVSSFPDRGDLGGGLDRRFHLRDDGSIDAWLSPSNDTYPPIHPIGATLDPRGAVTIHAAAPEMAVAATAGAHALAVSRDGDLFESADHGRSFRAAGRSPVPPTNVRHAFASPLGAVLGPVVRLGWGDARLEPQIQREALPEPRSQTPPPRRMACAPSGAPVPLVSPKGRSWPTAWGDPLVVARDPDPESGPKPAPPTKATAKPKAAKAPAPKPAATKPAATKPAAPKPHGQLTLHYRAPFAARASALRVDEAETRLAASARAHVTPLLGAGGEIDLLIALDDRELLVSGNKVTRLPLQESRRWMSTYDRAPGGLSLRSRALLLGHSYRSLALEDHGPGPLAAPAFLGAESDGRFSRPITLGRRDDGAVGVLVLDGAPAEAAGVAMVDASGAGVGPVTALAPWSTLVTADHPACAADRDGLRALIVIEPAAWLSLDPTAMPGLSFSQRGIVDVRWGRERVCLFGLDATLTAPARTGNVSLVARWGRGRTGGAALRSEALHQDLACRIP